MSLLSAPRLSGLFVAVVVIGAGVPAQAQSPSVRAVDTISDEAAISRALDDVEVDGERYRLIAADYERARSTAEAATARLAVLAEQERELAQEAARAGAAARLAGVDVHRWQRRVADLAVRAYIGADGDDAALVAGLDAGHTRSERRALLATEVDRHWQATLSARRDDHARVRSERDRLQAHHGDVLAEQADTERAHAEARAEKRRLRPTVHAARATATVVGSDLTLVALDAYLRAALEVGDERPDCGVPWWLLAGIGRVESGHGTFATSELDPAGTARPAIIGIALDGSNNTAVITDTDGGVLDGDPRSDRAVGPMQFIPSTWARYAADGNGDGIADPQNIYDGAHAAAAYLCTAGGDLRTDAGIRRGLFAYNHSDAYVAKVLAFTQEYTGLLA